MQATAVDELKWTADWSTLTCRERELFVAVQVQLCLEWERLEAVDEELPAQSGDLLSERMQQQQFAQDDRPVPDHCIKLEVQAQTQALVENTQTHVCPSALVRWWDTGAILSLITCRAGRLMVSSSRRALVATAGFTSSIAGQEASKSVSQRILQHVALSDRADVQKAAQDGHALPLKETELTSSNNHWWHRLLLLSSNHRKRSVLYWKQLIRICKAFYKEPLINKGYIVKNYVLAFLKSLSHRLMCNI